MLTQKHHHYSTELNDHITKVKTLNCLYDSMWINVVQHGSKIRHYEDTTVRLVSHTVFFSKNQRFSWHFSFCFLWCFSLFLFLAICFAARFYCSSLWPGLNRPSLPAKFFHFWLSAFQQPYLFFFSDVTVWDHFFTVQFGGIYKLLCNLYTFFYINMFYIQYRVPDSVH